MLYHMVTLLMTLSNFSHP